MIASASLVLAQGGRGYESLIFIVGIFAVLYFLILRPQKKKERQRKGMLSKVRRGDRVVTIGGIHGEVLNVKESEIILLVDSESGSTLKMTRSAVHRILGTDSEGDETK